MSNSKSTIGSKPSAEQVKATQLKAYETKTVKLYGPKVSIAVLPDYKESLSGQPKEYGLLMGAVTIAAIQASGYITISAKGAKATTGKPVSSRLFALAVSKGKNKGAYKHWTTTNEWLNDKGITDAGLQMVNYRLGFAASAPTKTGASTGKTSVSLVRDFLAAMKDVKSADNKTGIKGALNPTTWNVVTAHRGEPLNK